MLDSKNLVELIKQISSDAAETAAPCNFCYGKVISEKPLQILVEQKLTLSEMQLVLTRNVTDFDTEITPIEWKTEKKGGGSGEAAFSEHDHDIKKEPKKIKVHNALKINEQVILLQQRGGQKFLVLDRIVNL